MVLQGSCWLRSLEIHRLPKTPKLSRRVRALITTPPSLISSDCPAEVLGIALQAEVQGIWGTVQIVLLLICRSPLNICFRNLPPKQPLIIKYSLIHILGEASVKD